MRGVGAVHRAFSSFGGPLSHRSDPAGADLRVGGPELPLYLSSSLRRLRARPRNTRRHRGGNSWMVSCTKRWSFRTTGDTAHVGRDITGGSLLAVLDFAGARQRTEIGAHVCSRPCDGYCSCGLDGVPGWAIVSG